MAVILRRIIYTFTITILILWILMQTPFVQNWVRESIENSVRDNSDYEIVLGRVSGIAPFSLRTDSIEVYKKNQSMSETHQKICAITEVLIIPQWLDLIRGKISLLKLRADSLIIERTLLTADTSDNSNSLNEPFSLEKILPNTSLSLYSFSIRNIGISEQKSDKSENSSPKISNFRLGLKGSAHWQPSENCFNSKLKVQTYILGQTPLSFNLDIKLIEQTAHCAVRLEMNRIEHGSFFANFPAKHLSMHFDTTTDLAKLLSNEPNRENTLQDTPNTSFITGNWHVVAIPDDLDNDQDFPYGLIFKGSLHKDETGIVLKTSHVREVAMSDEKDIDRLRNPHALMTTTSQAPTNDIPHHSSPSLEPQAKATGSLYFEEGKVFCIDFFIPSFTVKQSRFEETGFKISFEQSSFAISGTCSAKTTQIIKKSASDTEELGEITLRTPIAFSSKWHIQPESKSIFFNEAIVSMCDVSLGGDLKLDFNPLQVSVNLEAPKQDISSILHLFNESVDAKAALTLRISPDRNDHIHKDVKAANHQVTIDALFEKVTAPGIAIEKIAVRSRGDGALQSLSLATSASIQDLFYHDLDIHACNVESTIHTGQLSLSTPFAIDCQGKGKAGIFSLQGDGVFTKDASSIHEDPIYTVNINNIMGSSVSSSFKNSLELHLEFNSQSCTILPFALQFNNGGALEFSYQANHEQVYGEFNALLVPIEILDPLIRDLQPAGLFTGSGKIWGKSSEPHCIIESEVYDFSWWDKTNKPLTPFSFHCKTTYLNELLHSTGELKGYETKHPLRWNCTFPVLLSAVPFNFGVLKDTPLSGNIWGEADLGSFLTPYLDDDEFIEGLVVLNIEMKGTSLQPDFTGNISIKDGMVDCFATGGELSNITMNATLQNALCTITTISGTDGKKGTFEGTGYVKIEPTNGLPYEIDLTLHAMELVQVDFANVVSSGKLKLLGNKKHALLSGEITTDSAYVSLATKFSSDLPNLKVIWVDESIELVKKLPPKNFEFGLDLLVSLPSNGYISGRGLESYWKGKVKIVGPPDQLSVTGKVLCDKGTLTFANKNFVISQGSIDFAGDVFTQSRLNVITTVDLGQVTAQIILRGSLDQPRFVLQSSPAMENKDIISWILFNKGSNDISPVQGIQLAFIVMTMNDSSQSNNLWEKFKQTFSFFDVIDINSGNQIGPQISQAPGVPSGPNNQACVEIGKYIYKDVLIIISRDITNQVNRAGIEVNLTKEITVSADVSNEEDAQVALNWKHNY